MSSVEKPAAASTAMKDDTAGLYTRWTLDCVIETAVSIANDYPTRYREYRTVSSEVAKLLANIRVRTGFDPEWPNTMQRVLIVTPLLGQSDAKPNNSATSLFSATSRAVRSAAIAYSERVYDTGEPMLRQAFVNTARQFQAYLTTLSGSVVDRANLEIVSSFRRSVTVLTNSAVAHAFGLPPAPEGWPLPKDIEEPGMYLDGDGAYLVDQVSRRLQTIGGPVTQQQFLALQRAAVGGAQTIQLVQQGKHERSEDVVRELIKASYSWATALRDLG
jgi:hypothetical protein